MKTRDIKDNKTKQSEAGYVFIGIGFFTLAMVFILQLFDHPPEFSSLRVVNAEVVTAPKVVSVLRGGSFISIGIRIAESYISGTVSIPGLIWHCYEDTELFRLKSGEHIIVWIKNDEINTGRVYLWQIKKGDSFLLSYDQSLDGFHRLLRNITYLSSGEILFGIMLILLRRVWAKLMSENSDY